MVVGEASINNIMSGIENAGGVKQHNHKKKLKQRFDIIKKLGQGTFGKVQLGINKETGQEVAIKTIKKSKIESEADLIRIRREIQIMSSVQHPNIIHIYEVFENREKMVLVMEYAAGGELYDYLSERKVLSEDEARRIFRQIATACYYCHKHKICHRDLKLENILLDENNNAKIADFGLSNVFDDQRLLGTFCGSPLYASPEIVKGTPYHGPEVDCWSLGVLLYTLVYGAMPFDGSNFKRLVKQISQGDYFEPAKPSPASPLIRDMLTVNPKKRSGIEKICSHWWVNETYDVNCLEISEELANQTPVRLDLLLSLAPPPPQLESDKLLVTDDVAADEMKPDMSPPTRSQSAGSLMELSHPEKRIKDLLNEDKASPKRKLESTVSTDRIKERRDKIIKENTVADITVHGTIVEDDTPEPVPLDKSLTQTISRDMDVENDVQDEDPSLQGAACTEIIEEAKAKEQTHETPSQDHVVNKENIEEDTNIAPEEKTVNDETKKRVKKKVLADQNETVKVREAEEPTKPVERRKSKIFEAAEKFQNMITPVETKPMPIEKPKKIVIPGVSVDGFKKEFERKASLTSTSPPKTKAPLTKKILIDQQKDAESTSESPHDEDKTKNGEVAPKADERKERVRNAVSIISSALDKEGTRKSKSRPCCVRKPPVPFGVGGRSASGNIGLLTSSPKPFVKPQFDSKPEVKKVEETIAEPPAISENQTSNAEITLKSATLPRRKTAKAEIQLNFPSPKPATMEFKTEMAHNVAAAPQPQTQRSEVVVPVANFKESASKERIIPIAFEKEARENVQSPPVRPPVAGRPLQSQKSNQSQRSGSLSRQSTQESDTETTSISGEPIKKSPREYIIPIAVEGGGYVTPRAGSLEPSETASTTSTMASSRSRNKFGKARRLNSLMSDREMSEDESNIYRDNDDSRKDLFHLHRLRSTRPNKILEHTDSLSSGEEEDDDDGFEILTAEHLFSNLLSRVRDLTQKLNVEDGGGRPGFPASHLLSHFDHGTNFWNLHNRLSTTKSPLSRHSSLGRSLSRDSNTGGPTPWRRSVSRDLATDIESVFKDNNSTTARPRGDRKSKKENLNLADLDLKKLKLSEEDALALSYLTPGLSRRIQKQLLAQLAPQLQRTLSASENNNNGDISRDINRSLPAATRRYSVEPPEITNNQIERRYSVEPETVIHIKYKSNLPKSSEFIKPKRTLSLREPKIYPSCKEHLSPENSISESYSTTTDSSSLNKYLNHKPTSDLSKLAQPRRISRFLRPDFYDPPKENVLVKEKKEREMETQKVLKEIRDKRKFRLNARRSREKSVGPDPERFIKSEDINKETDRLLDNVSNNIKNIEDNVKTTMKHDYVNVKVPKDVKEPSPAAQIHDYVNVKGQDNAVKKSRISKLVRPKSYPTENSVEPLVKCSPEKENNKVQKQRKGSKERDEENKSHKNRILQSIEKKLEKFRTKDPEKKSGVESAIKRLREQSLPRNLDHCTESGLIKRAVSVEDLTVNDKPLQTSRKSVTRILGLFKKYEEQDKGKDKESKKKSKEHKSPPKTESNEKKPERPRSLNIDKLKNGDKNDVSKVKSKLPVNSFRRSLNLDHAKSPELVVISPCADDNYRNSTVTDDSSVFLSPNDDRSDTWSQCSDLNSPTNGYHLCSGDESSESVIDRIRRKSFYTRFNEKKRARKPRSYKDLDLYKDLSGTYKPISTDYGSLDRRYDYRTPSSTRRSYLQEPAMSCSRDYKLSNDYVNVPNRYQTYSSKMGRATPAANLYSDEDFDEVLAGNSRKFGSRSAVSPANEYYRSATTSSPSASESHLLN